MPPVIVAAAAMAAGSWAAGAAVAAGWVVAGGIGASLIFAGAAMAISYAGNALIGQPNADVPQAAMDKGILLNKAGNAEPIPVVYGNRRVGGARVLFELSGETNEYLHIVLSLCEGPISAITTVFLNDVDTNDPKFTGFVDVYKHLGTDNQEADANLIAMFNDHPEYHIYVEHQVGSYVRYAVDNKIYKCKIYIEAFDVFSSTPYVEHPPTDTDYWEEVAASERWTSDHRLRGVAYLYLRLKWDPQVFSSGLPVITAEIDGKIVHDPRDSTDKYSRNPALCCRDYLTNARYGRGIATAMIDDTAIIVAANYCEEHVTVGGVTQDRYTCDGVVNIDDSSLANVQKLLSACRGLLIFSGGLYKLLIDKPASPTGFAFTEDNITGAWTISLGSKKNMLNRIRGNFFNPNRSWQPDIAIVESAELLALDNGLLLERSIELPFTADINTARQILTINLNQSRQQISCKFNAFIAGMRCEVGDVVPITHSTPGWTAKPFRILGISLKNNDEVTVLCREYSANVYDFGTIAAVDDTPDTNLPALTAIAAPADMEVTEEFYDTGVYLQSRETISWSAPADAFIASYDLEYKLSEDSVWLPVTNTKARAVTMMDLAPGNYDFRVRAVNTMFISSVWAAITNQAVSVPSIPETPASFTATLSGQFIELAWTDPANVAIQGHSIYLGGTALVTNFKGNKYVYRGNLTAATYNFTLKAVDAYGQESAATAAASITISVPSTPAPSVVAAGEVAVVTWSSCQTSLPIDHYAINTVAESNAPRYQERITWTSKQFSIVAVDIAGNQSAAGAVTLTISAATAVTGITPTGLTYAVKLTLAFTSFADFDAIEIWSGTVNNRANAVKVGESAAAAWTHNGLSLIDTRYYWTRIRDKYGNYGTWYPTSATAGVAGSTSQDPADYLSILLESITRDQLVADLRTPIDGIDTDSFFFEEGIIEPGIVSGLRGAFYGLADIAITHAAGIQDLLDTTGSHASDILGLQAEIAGLTTSVWLSTEDYTVGRYVNHDSQIWRATADSLNQEPYDGSAYWELADAISTLVSSIETRVDTLEGEITQKVSTVTFNALDDRVTAAESDITQNSTDILLRVTQTEFDAFSAALLPEFNADRTYPVNFYVRYEGAAYRTIQAIDFTPAPLPTDTDYWEQQDFADQFSTIINQLEIDETGISLISSAIIGPVALLTGIVEHGIVVEDMGDIFNLDCRITQAGIDIDGANATISLHTSLIDGIEGRLSQAEVDIDGANALITLKASQTDMDSLESDVTAAEIVIDGHTASISSQTTAISTLQSTTGTHTTQINQALIDIDAAEAAILLRATKTELDGIIAPVYSATTTYNTNDEVRYYSTSWKLYRCKENSTVGVVPTNTALWELLTALASRMKQAEVDIDAAEAAILLRATTSTVSGINSRLTQAEIDIDAAETAIALKVAISTYDTKMSSLDGSISTLNGQASAAEINITALQAADGTLQSNINAKVAISTYDTKMSSLDGSISTLNGQASAAETNITALQAADGTLQSNINAKVAISTYDTKMSSLDGSISTLNGQASAAETNITALQSADGTLQSNINNKVSISTYDTKMSSLDGSISALDSSVGAAEEDIGVLQTASGDIQAQYTVKLGVNGRIAGFGLMLSEGEPSEFAILADKFMICLPDGMGDPLPVFTVGEIGGEPTVGIQGNLIVDGSILTESLQDNAATALVIASSGLHILDNAPNETTLVSATINTTGKKVFITFSSSMYAKTSDSGPFIEGEFYITIYRDIYQIYALGPLYIKSSPVSFSWGDHPDAGEHTYAVKANHVTSNQLVATYNELTIVELKK